MDCDPARGGGRRTGGVGPARAHAGSAGRSAAVDGPSGAQRFAPGAYTQRRLAMPVSVGNILSRAFQIIINNRVFWALGFVLTLLTGNISFNVNRNPFTTTSSSADVTAAFGAAGAFACLSFLLFI